MYHMHLQFRIFNPTKNAGSHSAFAEVSTQFLQHVVPSLTHHEKLTEGWELLLSHKQPPLLRARVYLLWFLVNRGQAVHVGPPGTPRRAMCVPSCHIPAADRREFLAPYF